LKIEEDEEIEYYLDELVAEPKEVGCQPQASHS
jgi:hypothetical protein